jgi:hypothetical protein
MMGKKVKITIKIYGNKKRKEITYLEIVAIQIK